MSTVELTITYRNEKFRFENTDGDVVICEVDYVDGPLPEGAPKFHAIKGPDCDFEPHQSYRLYGRWSKYTNRRTGETEQQFHFETAVKAMPHSRAGVIRYIREAGKGNGIGQALATRLFERFGADAVRLLKEKPETAAAVKGVALDAARATGAKLLEQAHIEHCTIELMNLLDKRGFPKATAKRALDLWGNQAAEHIQVNPYLLMNFRGCGFKLTDAMYLDLGHEPAKLKRQALCCWHRLASNTDGHTWFPVEYARRGLLESVSGTRLRFADAVRLARRAAIIDTIRTDATNGAAKKFVDEKGHLWVSESKKARSERYVARSIIDALDEAPRWPTRAEISEAQPNATGHQLDNAVAATCGVIGSLGGSPGTGKTFTAAGIVQAIIDSHGIGHVAVCAPTGKAAVRITEAMQEYGLPLRAKTIHSLLKIDMSDGGDGGWSFVHKEGNPLPYRFVIVDESSMIDTDLMASLLAARGAGTHILFVGDVNQLPPVGHGAPLRDLIASDCPYGELREIKRNSGAIVRACAEMRDGERFNVCEQVDIETGDNLGLVDTNSPEKQIERLEQIFERAANRGFDPIWDCQVVVPVNDKSPVSRKELNTHLQHLLNKNPGQKNNPFRVADKIVNTKNGFFPAVEIDESDEDTQTNDRGDVYVANGELAEVLEAEAKFLVAKLSSPERTIRIPRGGDDGTGCAWDLGYAISVHKSQGSEWPLVIVILDEYPGARMVCDRSWVYTAISRAKKLCLLVGKMATAHRFCQRTKIHERQTFLTELIRHERAGRMLAEI